MIVRAKNRDDRNYKHDSARLNLTIATGHLQEVMHGDAEDRALHETTCLAICAGGWCRFAVGGL